MFMSIFFSKEAVASRRGYRKVGGLLMRLFELCTQPHTPGREVAAEIWTGR